MGVHPANFLLYENYSYYFVEVCMRITTIKTTDNQNFNGIYMKKKGFKKEQIEIADSIKKTLEKQTKSDENWVSNYKKIGFDFIIKTVDDKLVSLDVTHKFSPIRWLFQKKYPDNDNNIINIGIYNKQATDFLENDLKEKRPYLKLLNIKSDLL